MKRYPFFLLFILLLIPLNACGTVADPNLIAQTIIATSWTPTQTPTANRNIPTMVNWFNYDLPTANSLGWVIDAEYLVTNVSFPTASNRIGVAFQVDIGCLCTDRTDCCTPQRTFVVVIEALKRNASTILAQVPSETTELTVVCFDRQKDTKLGAMTVLWPHVQDYLKGDKAGYQLGALVTLTSAP